jgi:uncharacterized membrane protein YkoI
MALISAMLLSPPLWADDDEMEDFERARQLVSEGVILPLDTILSQINSGGKLLEVELERKHDRWIYELELLQQDGTVFKAKYDAQSGQLLRLKRD